MVMHVLFFCFVLSVRLCRKVPEMNQVRTICNRNKRPSSSFFVLNLVKKQLLKFVQFWPYPKKC